MKLLLVIIVGLCASVALGLLIANDNGYVLMTVSDWTVQTSVSLFAVVLVMSFILFYLVVRNIFRLLNLPADIKRWQVQRRKDQAGKYLNSGLIALVEGRWKNAEDDLVKGAKYNDRPLVNYLCAARAAQQLGRIDHRDYYLGLSQACAPDSKTAIGLTQAELQINEKQTELALATLNDLHTEKSGQKQVELMLLKSYTELKSWRQVLELLPGIEKYKLLPKEKITAIKLESYAGMMKNAGRYANSSKLDRTWNDIPGKLRKELYLLETYTLEKLRFGESEDCEVLLRNSLKKRWDNEIARLYGLIASSDSIKHLAFAESLAKGHTSNPILSLTLGRLSMRNGLWGKAEAYFKESLQIQPYPETYRELAILLEKQGDYSAAASYYQQGLNLATALPQHEFLRLVDQENENKATAGARQVV